MSKPLGRVKVTGMRRVLALLLLVIFLVAATAWGQPWQRWIGPTEAAEEAAAPWPTFQTHLPEASSVLVAAVGDMTCSPDWEPADLGPDECHQQEVSDLVVAAHPDAFLALGDLQYDQGDLASFQRAYQPSFGRLFAVTYPVLGNHEYYTAHADGYFAYFGDRAGPRDRGYYSFDLGQWHVVALNSQCDRVSCAAGSDQERWLRADLAAHPAQCTLAFMHDPRWSGGTYRQTPALAGMFQALYDGGVDLLLTGHDHDYQRFAPLSPADVVDPARGVRQIVVGTGGRDLFAVDRVTGSEAISGTTFGALFLRLDPTSYRWQFVPAAGGTFTDAGATACH